MVLDIMGRVTYHSIDNGNVDIYPSEYPFESSSEYVLDTDTILINSIDDDETYQLLEFFHSEYDDGLLYANLQMQYLLCFSIKME